jgi:hypothetical protein
LAYGGSFGVEGVRRGRGLKQKNTNERKGDKRKDGNGERAEIK